MNECCYKLEYILKVLFQVGTENKNKKFERKHCQ